MEIIQTTIRVSTSGPNHPLMGYLRLSSAYADGAVVESGNYSYRKDAFRTTDNSDTSDRAKGNTIT